MSEENTIKEELAQLAESIRQEMDKYKKTIKEEKEARAEFQKEIDAFEEKKKEMKEEVKSFRYEQRWGIALVAMILIAILYFGGSVTVKLAKNDFYVKCIDKHTIEKCNDTWKAINQ